MYFIDVQGTLISDADKTPIAGAKETIAYLNEDQTPYMIVTNNTKKLSEDFFEYLRSIEIDLKKGHYLDPMMLLTQKLGNSTIAPYGDPEFLATLKKMAFKIDFENPDFVLIGTKKDFTGEIFAQIIEFLLNGTKLIGMHETTLYAKDGKRYPGTGAILQMLKAATFADYTIVGKPSIAFYDQAKSMLDRDVKYDEITMISDDLKGDLVGAKILGMKTIFVLSGKYKTAQEIVPHIDEDLRPDYIMQDMQEVLEFIKGNR